MAEIAAPLRNCEAVLWQTAIPHGGNGRFVMAAASSPPFLFSPKLTATVSSPSSSFSGDLLLRRPPSSGERRPDFLVIHRILLQFCEKVTRGGITRTKNHLTGSSNNVKACPKCPKEVQEELKQYAADKKKQNNFEIPNVRELDLENTGFGESEDELENYRDFLPLVVLRGKIMLLRKGLWTYL
ncbi:hypothetical protein SESBI_22166 [Sesbania bispinosa]|nr:hypothetical protein SESBI_22166 [Sesbania bispinosa]